MTGAPIAHWTGRSGLALRFVLGRATPPALEFMAPDAPGWREDPTVRIEVGPRGRFDLRDGNVPVLSGTADPARLRLELEVGEATLYGFGAANGAGTRNDARFRLMTLDTMLYAIAGSSYTAMPFFIARSPSMTLGVLVATTYPLDVETGGGRVRLAASCHADDMPLDVIVFRGTAAEIVTALSTHAGRALLPPAWALGFHQSRWSYRTQGKVLAIARRFRELDLPADVVHLDIHYMDRYRVFTFHPRRFPDPVGMHRRLQDLGFRTLAIVDPGVSVAPYPVYEELRSQGLLLQRSDGQPYQGRVWPGATVFPDFTQPAARQAWARCHEPLLDAGVAGFWNDMNDPVLRGAEYYDPLAEDVWHHGIPHRRVRNVYANGMAEATTLALRRSRPGRRPFVLSRSGFLGIQRHAAVWTGDNHSTWQHLRENLAMVLNLGLSGVPLSGADVGGFARTTGRFGAIKPVRPSPELFIRWMELGAFMPFFRVHCTLFAPSQEPWSFGARALTLARRVLRRRYRWLLHLYRLALESHEQGLPIVRPLFMHETVPAGEGEDEFLFGRDVLVAPVLERGVTSRDVWLPPGEWAQWHDGRVMTGGRRVRVAAPLGRTPVFVRAGAAMFSAEPRLNAAGTLAAPLALEVTLPGSGATGRGSLFLDDGESADGRRFLLDVAVERATPDELRIELRRSSTSFTPSQDRFELYLPSECGEVQVDGCALPLAERRIAPDDRDVTRRVASVPLAAATLHLILRPGPVRAEA